MTKPDLSADVGDAVFDDTVKTGDIVGPIHTTSGDQLFFVETRYSGPLDDRAEAAIAKVRQDPAPDVATYTAAFSPADTALAADAGWRAQAEFDPNEPVATALFETPTGELSDPFVLDGKLALAIVDTRRDAPPDARMLDRLSLNGYDAWFAGELAKATIDRNPVPLPELVSPSPTASAAPQASLTAAPSLPLAPIGPSASPVKTDALGLPVLP